ncbi:TrmH family RNA methyltransferase [Candidatus Dojkabacteria bacterium]|jgi:tRNA G18 (ribose-2'-O)-methylase SpoU|nr:TrmH family RNA methyltransferase [Candidatus Dojkabacteria bacterium]
MKIYVIIDNIRSAYNVGSVFRTADGVGCCEILICGISPKPDHIKVAKTALGATETVPWQYFKTTSEAIDYVKAKGIPVWSVELTPKAVNYTKVKYPNEVAIIFGHETEGINKYTLEKSDKILSIPMRGAKNSLNVATCAGIILYEAIKNAKD